MHSHLEKPLLVTLIYNTHGFNWVKHHLTQPFLFQRSERLKNRPYSNVVVDDCLSRVFYGTAWSVRMKTKKIYPSLLRRTLALSVSITAFIVLIWPQPPLLHILSHRSSHYSCQSVHRLISATLFVSIPSSSHLSLSKSSCNWLRHASSHHYFIVRWQIILQSSTNKSIRRAGR